MSKIKLTGNASGTGVLTVTAPNTSTDRVITLPDEDVTLGAATPSIDDNGDATAITIDSSEKVNFNQGRLQLGHINKFIDTANYVGDAINIGSHPYANGTVIGQSYPADSPTTIKRTIHTTGTETKFFTVSGATETERVRIDQHGIKFNGDTAADNALDDYEEGDWTPTWVVANGTVTSYNNLNTGKYTKIGRTVFIWGYLSFGSQSGTTSTDDLNLGGLPFAAGNGWGQSSAYTGGVHTIGLYNWVSGKAPDYSHFGTGSSHRLVRKDGTTEVALTVADFNTGANHSQFRFQGQYNIA